MKKIPNLNPAILTLTSPPLTTLTAGCVGTGCELENRFQATEKRLTGAEAVLAALVQKKPEAALQCQAVNKDSEVLIYEDRVVIDSEPVRQGYSLVGGDSLPDWKKYEMPASVVQHPQDTKWVCFYKNSGPARISGIVFASCPHRQRRPKSQPKDSPWN